MNRFDDPKPLSALATHAGAKAYARYGFTEQALLNRWSAIMGETLGAMSLPLKLSYPRGAAKSQGTLRIMAEGPAALELQHLAPVIVERINSAFGYAAVGALSIVQGPVARQNGARQNTQAPNPALEQELAALLSGLNDETLKKSLAQLGRRILGK